ncbi:HEPN domain-containing protein [Stenotrophomonas sp. PS02289]|uniref:HEPN domain-containing protein n=1 Tax=Stenotrophomonas sp. PS02289 TaxID=2991422 RepID=UPI00249A62B7|nr:HEPN domain-containing protein [Stenotrophomonas sp. PS02289]
MREFQLPGGRSAFLSESGFESFQSVCQILRCSHLVEHTEPHDSVNAFRAIVQNCLSNGERLNGGQRLVDLVVQKLELMRKDFWYVVPVHGVELNGIESIDLGCLSLETPTELRLEGRGAKLAGTSSIEEMIGCGPCLVGSVFGSESYARREFKFRTDVATGVLAVVAAASFKQGASPFRITTEADPAGIRAPRRSISWHSDKPDVLLTRAVMDHQSFRIDAEFAAYLREAAYVSHILGLPNQEELSELESALIRGLFWFSDAQRDTSRVMQLVKYWSCAEAIFSGEKTGITKALTEGVAIVLVACVKHEPPDQYRRLVARLAELYELRCNAVHEARHDQVEFGDVATLSHWTAWMLLGVGVLIHDGGYTSSEEVRRQCRRLAKVLERSE